MIAASSVPSHLHIQGSVLGPLLFLITIFFIQLSEGTKMSLYYADEILIYKPIVNETSYHALQQDINKISEWLKIYHMHFNPAKCKCMLLTQTSNPHSHALTLNGEILEMVTQYKYLGVTISSEFHWTPHIKQICSNANKLVGLIYRNFATNKVQNPYLVLILYHLLFDHASNMHVRSGTHTY